MWYDIFISVGREQRKDKGEDACAFCGTENAAMIGVFDGLGGSGARRYPAYRENTGAYMASRAVAGFVKEWFSKDYATAEPAEPELRACIEAALDACSRHSGTPGGRLKGIKGSIFHEFPTTAAIAVCRPQMQDGKVRDYIVDYIWAGDSRGYLLCENGLVQITTDDADEEDIRSSMNSDAPMNNVISHSEPWELHRERLLVRTPGIVITATDGSFGYWSSPMELEHILLKTMRDSENAMDWQDKLDEEINSVAGDDFTLLGLAFGFDTFENMKAKFNNRLQILEKDYIKQMKKLNHESAPDYEKLLDLWETYSKTYLWEVEKVQHSSQAGIKVYP